MATADIVAELKTILTGTVGKIRPHFSGLIASSVVKLIRAHGAHADQHQANGTYGVHQLRIRLPGDETIYRVIIAPADAPLKIGGCPVDQHFLEPISAEVV